MQTSGTALPPVRARTVSATPDTFGFRESSAFQPELEYLEGERRLGRLATVDGTGQPHVVPVGWSYNPELGTIDTVAINSRPARSSATCGPTPRSPSSWTIWRRSTRGGRGRLWSRATPRRWRLPTTSRR